jgi:hypothetical protein
MTDYELIEILMRVQHTAAGHEVPHEFNQMAVDKMSGDDREVVITSLDVLGKTEGDPMLKMRALKTIMEVSKVAHDFEVFNEVTHKWLNGEQYLAGVDTTGRIVLWDEKKPESRISLRA